MSQVTTANVVYGAAFVWYAPAGTPNPAYDPVNYPVSFGGDGTQTLTWQTPWTPIGATVDGVTLTVATSTGSVDIEESSAHIATPITTQVTTLGFNMSEATFATFKLAYGAGTITTVAATPTTYGTRTFQLSQSLDNLCFVVDMVSPPGTTPATTPICRRLYIPSATSGASVATAYRRNAAQQEFPTTITANCPQSQIYWTDYLPKSTS